ncbi:diguanylate cyclase domain-containing protein [Virgibacillus sp. W0181]|uniref:sensor domain-containing diguanylate cyclase n=1 Tax=Virgibacillus sp. W0181 TaxID=3391581 RepID=UPI003F47EF7D
MENEKNSFAEKLRSSFFELTHRIPQTSYEEIIQQLTKRLNDLLNGKYTSMYIYNNWDMDELISHDPEAPAFIEKAIEKLKQQENIHSLFDDLNVASEVDVIKIDLDKGMCCYLFYICKATERCRNYFLQAATTELKHFLKIVQRYYKGKVVDTRSDYLFDLQSRFHPTVPVATILEEISKEMHVLYPTFSYCFLLSQDYEQSDNVPVKTMEYSGEAANSLSTKAFITGKMQQKTDKAQEKTFLYAPLNGSQGVYGVIQIAVPRVVSIPHDEIEFIRRFANTAGYAIERVTLYQNSTRLVSDLQLINDTSHKLNSNLKLNEIIQIIKHQMAASCPDAQIGFIYSNARNDGSFEILPGSTSYFKKDDGRKFADFIFGRIMKQPKSIFIGDFTQDIGKTPYRSVMAVPMQMPGNIYGAIMVMHEEPYSFSFEKFKLMESLVQHATLAISNTVLKEKLEKTAITDYLTKLHSRNYLDEELNRHMATEQQGTLVLFDIDNFKLVNDTFGHYTGDKVIIQIADTIKKYIRKSDTAARWGGEEFAIYLPGITTEDGIQIAERIREKVEDVTNPKVTLSCGISTWIESREDSVRDLFIRADKALYEAKGTGKNRVVSDKEKKQKSS